VGVSDYSTFETESPSMLRRLVFRDDDISYFSSPQVLWRLYGRLWEARKPVVFGVIGEITIPNLLPHLGNAPDPNVPAQFAHDSGSFSLCDNTALVELLGAKARQGLIQPAVHGWTHEYAEFERHDRATLEDRLDKACALMEGIAGYRPRFFIPPYEMLSTSARQLLDDRRLGVFAHSRCLGECPATIALSHDRRFAIVDRAGTISIACDIYLFPIDDLGGRDETVLSKALGGGFGEFVVCALHSWSFRDATADRWKQWDQMVEAVLDQDVDVTTPEAIELERSWHRR